MRAAINNNNDRYINNNITDSYFNDNNDSNDNDSYNDDSNNSNGDESNDKDNDGNNINDSTDKDSDDNDINESDNDDIDTIKNPQHQRQRRHNWGWGDTTMGGDFQFPVRSSTRMRKHDQDGRSQFRPGLVRSPAPSPKAAIEYKTFSENFLSQKRQATRHPSS